MEPRDINDPSTDGLTDAQKWVLGGVGAVVVILVGIVSVLALGGGDEDSPTTTSTTTTATSTTTTVATTTTTSPPMVDPYTVAYPPPGSDDHPEDPAEVVRRYAIEMLGFTDLYVGVFQGDDTGEVGEVVISDRQDGPATFVAVERLDDGDWYVRDSATDDIVVEAPTRTAGLGSPFETRGQAVAFEGTVDIVVRSQDGAQRGSGFVTGSGAPPAGPFDGQIYFGTPREDQPGVIVYRTLSAEDGHVEKATSFPVRLTTQTTPTAAVTCGTPDTSAEAPEDPETDKVVKVFFHCNRDLIAARRTVPTDDPAVLTNSLRKLLEGPTAPEITVGYTSVFPVDGGSVSRVVITDGAALIDLAGIAALEASPQNVEMLADQLVATATQYTTVTAVDLHFDGTCEAYMAWAGTDTCRLHE